MKDQGIVIVMGIERIILGNESMDLAVEHDSKVTAGYSIGVSASLSFKNEFKTMLERYKKTIVVIDRSGSMSNYDRWDQVVQAVKTLIGGSSNVKYIFFNESVTGVLDKTTVNVNKANWIESTSNGIIRPSGNTNIARGLFGSIEEILSDNGHAGKENNVILFTDGQSNQPFSEMGRLEELTRDNSVDQGTGSKIMDLIPFLNHNSEEPTKQLVDFCKLFDILSIGLHVFGVGIHDNERYKELLNHCVNVSRGFDIDAIEIKENEDDYFLIMPSPNDPRSSNFSFLITNEVFTNSGLIPSLKVQLRFVGLAGKITVSMIKDNTNDGNENIDVDSVVDGSDIVIEKKFSNVKIQDVPTMHFSLYVGKDTVIGQKEIPVSIKINDFDLPEFTMNVDVEVNTYNPIPVDDAVEATRLNYYTRLSGDLDSVAKILTDLEKKEWKNTIEIKKYIEDTRTKLNSLKVTVEEHGG